MRSCWRPTRRTEPSGSSAPSGRSSRRTPRSEEHTSELQSRSDLVCRLLLEKKKNDQHPAYSSSDQKMTNQEVTQAHADDVTVPANDKRISLSQPLSATHATGPSSPLHPHPY